MNKTNTYSTILGGCWREKVVSVFRFGHSKTHFRAPKNGHFCQKCPFSGAQKWDFECPNPKSETTFSRQHPPKMVEKVFVLLIYHFWTRNKQIQYREIIVLLHCYNIKHMIIWKVCRPGLLPSFQDQVHLHRDGGNLPIWSMFGQTFLAQNSLLSLLMS